MAGKEDWYYKKDSHRKGPISLKELETLLSEGEVEPSTPVWTENLKDWIALSDAIQLNFSTLDDVPDIAIEKPVDYPRETDEEFAKPHPWIRFWARMIDYTLFFLILSFLLMWVRLVIFPAQSFFGMTCLFLWVFVESLLLSSWGATPGKWLLNCKVRDQYQHKLSFSHALNRSFSVWWIGMGAGIPIVFLITMIVAAVKLSNTGMTSWDRRSHYQVIHGKVGLIRTFIVILYFLCFVWLFSWGQVELFYMQTQ